MGTDPHTFLQQHFKRGLSLRHKILWAVDIFGEHINISHNTRLMLSVYSLNFYWIPEVKINILSVRS